MRLALYTFLSIMLTLSGYSHADEDEAPKPSYFSLEPSIVVNLRSGGKFSRVDIQIMTLDEEQLENIKLHAPAIRHELILLLSDQDGKQLKTPDGKELFRKAALAATQKVIKELTGVDSINELYFTSFFVQ